MIRFCPEDKCSETSHGRGARMWHENEKQWGWAPGTLSRICREANTIPDARHIYEPSVRDLVGQHIIWGNVTIRDGCE